MRERARLGAALVVGLVVGGLIAIAVPRDGLVAGAALGGSLAVWVFMRLAPRPPVLVVRLERPATTQRGRPRHLGMPKAPATWGRRRTRR